MRYVSDYIAAVKAEQVKISVSLTSGHLPNFETYQRLVGQYQGLETCLDILNNLLKEDDEDE